MLAGWASRKYDLCDKRWFFCFSAPAAWWCHQGVDLNRFSSWSWSLCILSSRWVGRNHSRSSCQNLDFISALPQLCSVFFSVDRSTKLVRKFFFELRTDFETVYYEPIRKRCRSDIRKEGGVYWRQRETITNNETPTPTITMTITSHSPPLKNPVRTPGWPPVQCPSYPEVPK